MPNMVARALPLVVVAALAGSIGPYPAAAQDVAAFYRGKTLQVYASAEAGSGYDIYTRLVARHIGKYIPGNPNIVVENMPTASGLAEANYLYNQAPRDGTAFGIITNNMTVEPLIGNKNARFDPSKFTWLGSPEKLVNVCVTWHTVPVRTADDLRNQEWLVGATAERSSTTQEANVFIALGGAKLKVVKGYPSTTSMILALERGELQIACGIGWDSVKSSTTYLQDGKIIPVMQLGYQKSPEMPNVPFIYDMLLDPKLKPELDFITQRLYIGRAFAAPPDVPADRAAALRDAFWQTMHDPDFLADAQKGRFDLDPTRAEDIQKQVEALAATPQEVIALTDQILENQLRNVGNATLNWHDVSAAALTAVDKGQIVFSDGRKPVKASTEGAKISIAGRPAKGGELKAGLTCDISYLGDGDAARTIACR
ncbi:MAG TPA: hypothetical protein VG271_13875 [Beijerinckiaceae bacterium]|nr:hypothetical protein [Beijerinckiaceae bacterium]